MARIVRLMVPTPTRHSSTNVLIPLRHNLPPPGDEQSVPLCQPSDIFHPNSITTANTPALCINIHTNCILCTVMSIHTRLCMLCVCYGMIAVDASNGRLRVGWYDWTTSTRKRVTRDYSASHGPIHPIKERCIEHTLATTCRHYKTSYKTGPD